MLLDPGRTGIQFINSLQETAEKNYFTYQYIYNGGGVAAGDVNNDGLPDLFFTANQQPDKLYINEGGLHFRDASSGLDPAANRGWSTGVTMADVNGDGWLDIYVCKSAKYPAAKRENVLYINQGNGKFVDQAKAYGLNDPGFSTQASFFDYDRDGDLDMYLMNHPVENEATLEEMKEKRFQRDPMQSDKLYRNNGDNTFTDVSCEAGLLPDFYGYGLGLVTADINDDGWTDIYVANDYTENDYCYLNNGDGTFREAVTELTDYISHYGMGCDIADFNNDGLVDIVVLDMLPATRFRQKTMLPGKSAEEMKEQTEAGFYKTYMQNTLQLNEGNGHFREIAWLAGVAATDWSWAALFADLDNDGWKDLYITNGFLRDVRNMDVIEERSRRANAQGIYRVRLFEELNRIPSVKLANFAFRNGGGLSFSNVTSSWGLNQGAFSNGAVVSDLDGDGDLDLVVNNLNDYAFVYENRAMQQGENHYLQVRLETPGHTALVYNAKVRLETASGLQVQEYTPVRGYESAMTGPLHFGLGKEETVNRLTVEWPDGHCSELQNVAADQLITVSYNQPETCDRNRQPAPELLFSDITAGAGVSLKTIENPFDDRSLQPLLPFRRSDLGSPMAAGDVNGDGRTDIWIGGAAGQESRLLIREKGDRFHVSPQPAFRNDRRFEDGGAAFLDADGDGDLDLYVASGGYEMPHDANHLQDRLYWNDGKGNFRAAKDALPEINEATAVVLPLDFDQDGDLDLLVCGRLTPGRYPEPPRSYLLENREGRFTDVTRTIAPGFLEGGNITDAVMADISGDGKADLVLAGEFMPIRVFSLENGRFMEIHPGGLSQTHGWWQSLQTADLDEDGDLDLIAGNLGLNHPFRVKPSAPAEWYLVPLPDGTKRILVSQFERDKTYPFLNKNELDEYLPGLTQLIPDHASYARTTTAQLLGPLLNQSTVYRIFEWRNAWFENLGNGNLVMHPLPDAAQLTPGQALLAADFNLDSHTDLLIAGSLQMLYARYPSLPAAGFYLLGDGKGNFRTEKSYISGFQPVPGSRSLAISANDDGNLLLLCAGSNAGIRVFRLEAGKDFIELSTNVQYVNSWGDAPVSTPDTGTWSDD